MKVENIKCKEVNINRIDNRDQYIALYTTDYKCWMASCPFDTEEEAITSIDYMPDVVEVKVIMVTLPFELVPEHIKVN